MIENNLQEISKSLKKFPWSSVYTTGGVLDLSQNITLGRVCYTSNLIIISKLPLLVYVEDLGKYKEVKLNLNVEIDEKFGEKEYEKFFRPQRMEVKNFPPYCRMDLFFNEKLSVCQIIEEGEDQKLLTGIVLGNPRGDRLGIYIDEKIPGDLLLTTDGKLINKLCEK